MNLHRPSILSSIPLIPFLPPYDVDLPNAFVHGIIAIGHPLVSQILCAESNAVASVCVCIVSPYVGGRSELVTGKLLSMKHGGGLVS